MPMPMLVEVVDTHEAQIASTTGTPVAAQISPQIASRDDAYRLATSRASGDRDALRILLRARQHLTSTITGQSNRLRALLLSGNDTDRKIARGALTALTLASLARRREPPDATSQRSVRHAEIRRLALAISSTGRELKANNLQLQAIVDDLAPGLTDRRGIGPISAAQAILSVSHPSTVPAQNAAART